MPQGSPLGPRVLLRRLREIMAEPQDTQTRLNLVVSAIAANLVAEVCSLYLLRGDNRLELYATEGLNSDAVHQTFLQIGEGLIGTVAQTAKHINLSDAQAHPKFAYRPETGEEIYKSMMGVPIMRGGRVIGVLAVQNRTMRNYVDEELETLETVAMVLAEVAASGTLVDVETGGAGQIDPLHSHRLHGTGLAEGIVMGQVVLHEPRVDITQIIAVNPAAERQKLDEALQSLRQSVDRMLRTSELDRAGEHREVLQAYQMFAQDKGWTARLHEAVDSGLTAAAAAERVQMENRARMQKVTQPYLRERLQDLDDLANRLLRHLTGKTKVPSAEDLPDDAIVVAHTMGPAELLDYDRSKLAGIVLEEGSRTSHVAIVARALEIPMVGGVSDILDWVQGGDAIIVDGELGAVYLRPAEDVRAAYAERMDVQAKRQAQYEALRLQPSVSRDGVAINLEINAGLIVDLPHLDDTGANGIGLFRTELQFLISAVFPRFEEQRRLYATVLDTAGERRVLFRTLDIGADKALPYLEHGREENPAMGWRATRLAMERPGLLRYQLRALLAAGSGRQLNIMFPMICDIAEFVQAREMVEQELARLDRRGIERPATLRIGTMLEVPALVWQLDRLLPLVDFVSVGSNDLLQFFFAYDRGNPKLAGRYDSLSAGGLRLLSHIAHECDAHQVPLSLCGELAGRPLEAMALIGLGFRSLSMSPISIGPVKLMLVNLDVAAVGEFMGELIRTNREDIRAQLISFATSQQVPV